MELKRKIAYRVDFWISFGLIIAIELIVAYALWSAIYQANAATSIAGYSFKAMMLYYLIAAFVVYLTRAVDLGFLAEDIYKGTLTKYLLYPVSPFGYKFATYLAGGSVYLVQLLIAYAAFIFIFGVPSDLSIGASSFIFGVLASFFALIALFLLSLIIEMAAFWAEFIWALVIMMRFILSLLGGELLPLALFPDWAQSLLSYTPFPYVISFPILCFLGKVPAQSFLFGILVLTLWSALIWFIMLAIWKRGCKHYTGVGI